MKTMTSTGKARVVFGTMILAVVLGAGPVLAQQAVKPAPMKSIQVKPVTRVIPDVIGKPLSEARKILKKARFTKVEINGTRAKNARVQAQKPKGGEKAPLNTKIILKTKPRKTGLATTGTETTKNSKSARKPTSGIPGIGTSPIAPSGDRKAPWPDLPDFLADKPIAAYPPKAILEIITVKFTFPFETWPGPVLIETGLPIRIYVKINNRGPADSTTSDFRVYLSRAEKILQKVKSHAPPSGLRGNRATYADFSITLPNNPGRYCWVVSLQQTLNGRMILGDPKSLCANLKPRAYELELK